MVDDIKDCTERDHLTYHKVPIPLDDQHTQPIPSGITLVISQIVMINNIDQVLYSTHDTEHLVHRGNNLLRKITEFLFNIF